MSVTRYMEAAGGQGSALTEANLTTYYTALGRNASHIVSGGALTDGGGVTFDMSAVVGFVDGKYQSIGAVTGQTVADDDVNYVWLDSDGTITDEVTGTRANAVLLGTVTTSGGSVTAVSHQQDILNANNVVIRKPSDETNTGDADFTFTANPREIWDISIVYFVKHNGTSEDMFVGLYLPSGGATMAAMGPDDDNIGASTIISGNAYSLAYAHTGVAQITNQIRINHNVENNGVVYARNIAFIGSAGGALTAKWSRNGVAATLTVQAGSYMIARRIFG